MDYRWAIEVCGCLEIGDWESVFVVVTVSWYFYGYIYIILPVSSLPIIFAS